MTWLVLGESALGTSHRGRGLPCQDAWGSEVLGPAGEWLVLAVADGAGSAARSELGAKLTCDEFIRQCIAHDLNSLLDETAIVRLFYETHDRLVAEALRLDLRPRDVACTAALAIIGPNAAMVAQIGDGAIILGYGGDEYEVAFWPEPAEYANATDFISEANFRDTLRISAISAPIVEVAMLTDGLQRLALDYSSRAPHADFFRPLFAELRAAENPQALTEPFQAFLDSTRVNERTDDDKTLVIASCQK